MFNNILLAIDLADKEKHEAALVATRHYAKMGSNIIVVSVIPLPDGGGYMTSFLPQGYDEALIENGRKELKAFTDAHLSEVNDVKVIVAHGKVYEKITDIAEQLDTDLIVIMASLTQGKKNADFGPNAARVVRNSNCSVLVVR